MIAKIDFRQGNAPAVAVLDDDGNWTSDAPLASLFLTSHYPFAGSRPSDGIPGRKQAIDAAQALGGVASFPPDPPDVAPKRGVVH